jgi:hypothetical protein
MRLSEWRLRAPFKESASLKVMAVVEEAMAALGADRDPECWVAWGDDPHVRWFVLAPTPAGMVQLNVRVNVAGEGPRASGKLVRWSRIQLGEFGVEIQGGHRLVTFQVEALVLNGADADADRIGAFAQVLFAAVDGRPAPALGTSTKRRASGSTAKKKPAARATAKPATPAKPAGRSMVRIATAKGTTR